MYSVLKSYSFSLILHASLVAALFAIPTSATQRFSQTGQTQVIAIEATTEKPSSTTVVSMEPESMTFASQLDSLVDRMAQTEPAEAREFVDTLRKPDWSDTAKLQMPESLPELPTDREVMLRQRRPDEVMPQVMIEETPPRPKMPRHTAEPPTPATIPIEQFVGLEKETSVDLSANKPPTYPLEAVRNRLEGVVVLKLRINTAGAVTSAELVESSGHDILDQAAINAVSFWQGTPAKRWGRAVESIERLPIRFRL